MLTKQRLAAVGMVVLCGACSILNKFDDIVPEAQGGRQGGGGGGIEGAVQAGGGGRWTADGVGGRIAGGEGDANAGDGGGRTGGGGLGVVGASGAGAAGDTAGMGSADGGTGGAAEPSARGGRLSTVGGAAGANPSGGGSGQAVTTGGSGGTGATAAGDGQGGALAGSTGRGGALAGDSGAGGSAGSGGSSTGIGGTTASAGSDTGGVTTGGAAAGGITTGGVSTGGADTGGAPATGGCPGTGGPAMVMLPQGYCIDSTEVTRAQYAAWLSTTTAATINAQDVATCSWNTTFTPDATCMSSSYVCQGTSCDNHPQVCVDWCDAYAYCLGVGKRLCGKIGGGMNALADFADATLSQWHAACTSNGAYNYPYGSNYSTTACSGNDYWVARGTSYTTTPVGSLSGCQAPVPYAGVYDLSGNVWEFEDSCNSTTTGQTAQCRIRGGSFSSNSSILACAYPYAFYRNIVYNDTGFRCCAL
jgi:sulfatase modifying factor 1